MSFHTSTSEEDQISFKNNLEEEKREGMKKLRNEKNLSLEVDVPSKEVAQQKVLKIQKKENLL